MYLKFTLYCYFALTSVILVLIICSYVFIDYFKLASFNIFSLNFSYALLSFFVFIKKKIYYYVFIFRLSYLFPVSNFSALSL